MSYSKCPVPKEQQPTNEFLELSNSIVFSLPKSNKKYILVLISIWVIFFLLFLIISSGSVYYSENNFKYSRSLFDDYGNMGSSNLVMGIIQGIQLLNEGMPFVDIIDRDLYGRESHVRIAKC